MGGKACAGSRAAQSLAGEGLFHPGEGSCLEQRWGELEAVLSTSERNVPDDLDPYFEAANALLESGVDLKRGEAYLRKYLAQEPEGEEPDVAHAHRLLGLILGKQGRIAEAITELEAAVQMNPRFRAARDDLNRVKSGSR